MVKRIKTADIKTLYAGKQKAMLAELGAIRKGVFHAPSMGETSENRWRKFLGDHLPNRYRVEKAFVVDSRGKISDQIDCVIFDRQYSSLVFNQNGLIYVPAESVYAVLELKQNINKSNLKYSAEKIASVRKLHRTSIPVRQISGKFLKKELFEIIGGLLAIESDYSPAFGTSFQKQMGDLKRQKKINIVYSLRDGLCNYPKFANFSLVLFLNELLNSLQKVGNAPAIDYSAYSKLGGKL